MAAAWETRFAQLVRTATAARESSALEVLPDLMPVLPVLEPSSIEHMLERRERLCSGYWSITAVAGQTSCLVLGNESPGLLVSVDEVRIDFAANDFIRWDVIVGSVPAGAPSTGGACFLDARGAGTATAPVALRRGFNSAAPPTLRGGNYRVTANTNVLLPVQAVLPPGSYLMLMGALVNTAFQTHMRWRERTVDAAELGNLGA